MVAEFGVPADADDFLGFDLGVDLVAGGLNLDSSSSGGEASCSSAFPCLKTGLIISCNTRTYPSIAAVRRKSWKSNFPARTSFNESILAAAAESRAVVGVGDSVISVNEDESETGIYTSLGTTNATRSNQEQSIPKFVPS